MFLGVLLLSLACSSLQHFACEEELDLGHPHCRRQRPGIRWYYDSEVDMCLIYYYRGCGGGKNTFITERGCRRKCIPADRITCAGNEEHKGTCGRKGRSCPAGSTCRGGNRGILFGFCCDDRREEFWERESNPTCKSGRLLTRTGEWGEEPVLGRSCSHGFCPLGYECVQGEFLAYCCRKRKIYY
ncbi:hypothetical protein Y032_0003g1445 [Ancylostoma ceylanicum]|uniref:BPTI/Kunitz inhibitor domain-containing protein n=1 Tax=Ancylostoma ceylanicum TaxID=53326 RepID=A0A016VX55_9BILA|nr:hypothetical protein Y032_0003g1445 [Ancylostoma ceylanicum]